MISLIVLTLSLYGLASVIRAWLSAYDAYHAWNSHAFSCYRWDDVATALYRLAAAVACAGIIWIVVAGQ